MKYEKDMKKKNVYAVNSQLKTSTVLYDKLYSKRSPTIRLIDPLVHLITLPSSIPPVATTNQTPRHDLHLLQSPIPTTDKATTLRARPIPRGSLYIFLYTPSH